MYQGYSLYNFCHITAGQSAQNLQDVKPNDEPTAEVDSTTVITERSGRQTIRLVLSLASSSSQTPFSASDMTRLGCNRLNDHVYELYKPESGTISVEIVFFHGFRARGCEDAFIRTWMTEDGSECWLNTWLVTFFPQARILSVSYDSSARTSDCEGRLDMFQIAENLVHLLIEILRVGQEYPVVLVGHCVGGLVLKEICLKAFHIGMQDLAPGLPHRKFLQNVRGMFFFSTAHLGSHIPVRADSVHLGPLLEFMPLLNKRSARVIEQFATLRRRYDWKTYGVIAANETRTMMLMPYFDSEIVPSLESAATSEYLLVVGEGSGRNDVDKFFTISGVDHFSICSPKDQKSDSFLILVDFLESTLREEEQDSVDLQRRLQLPPAVTERSQSIYDVMKLLDLNNPKPLRLSLVGMDGIG